MAPRLRGLIPISVVCSPICGALSYRKKMPSSIEVKVPDIGDFENVPVIDVLVRPGDSVKTEQPLITLESDKASMDVPSPVDGVVKQLMIKVGDKVSQGAIILIAETEAAPAGVAPKEKV